LTQLRQRNLRRKLSLLYAILCPDNLPEEHQKIGDFIVTSHSLGTGSFATVHLAMDHQKHRQVACKIIKAKNGKEVSSLMKEVDILSAVQHVCISTCFQCAILICPWGQPNINRILAVEEHHRFLSDYLYIASCRSSLLCPDIFFFNCAPAATCSPTSRVTKKVKVDYVKARQSTSCINS
jgi:serine/threonine protein kinase